MSSEENQILRDIQRRVFVCMETGNHEEARTVITELREYNAKAADALQSDVTAAYGIVL